MRIGDVDKIRIWDFGVYRVRVGLAFHFGGLLYFDDCGFVCFFEVPMGHQGEATRGIFRAWFLKFHILCNFQIVSILQH